MSSAHHSKGNAGGSDRKPSHKQGAPAKLPSVPLIVLHASAWRTKEDVYSALLPALGAPSWHGHNLDALNDSFCGGAINAVEPPLILRFVGLSRASSEVRSMIAVLEEIVADAREAGRMYEIQKVESEPSNSSE